MRSAAIILALLTGACSAKPLEVPPYPDADFDLPGLAVSLRSIDGNCEIMHAQQTEWSTEVDEVLKAASAFGSMHISASEDTPWECVASMIAKLQESGMPVGFITKPIEEAKSPQ